MNAKNVSLVQLQNKLFFVKVEDPKRSLGSTHMIAERPHFAESSLMISTSKLRCLSNLTSPLVTQFSLNVAFTLFVWYFVESCRDIDRVCKIESAVTSKMATQWPATSHYVAPHSEYSAPVFTSTATL